MLRRLVQRLLTPFATVLGLFTISGVYKTVSALAKAARASSSACHTRATPQNDPSRRSDELTKFCRPRAARSTGRYNDSTDRHHRTRRSGDIRWLQGTE